MSCQSNWLRNKGRTAATAKQRLSPGDTNFSHVQVALHTQRRHVKQTEQKQTNTPSHMMNFLKPRASTLVLELRCCMHACVHAVSPALKPQPPNQPQQAPSLMTAVISHHGEKKKKKTQNTKQKGLLFGRRRSSLFALLPAALLTPILCCVLSLSGCTCLQFSWTRSSLHLLHHLLVSVPFPLQVCWRLDSSAYLCWAPV